MPSDLQQPTETGLGAWLDPRNEAFKDTTIPGTPGGFLGTFGQGLASNIGGLVAAPFRVPGEIMTAFTNPDRFGQDVTNFVGGLGKNINEVTGEPFNPQTGQLQAPSALHAANYWTHNPLASALTVEGLKEPLAGGIRKIGSLTQGEGGQAGQAGLSAPDETQPPPTGAGATTPNVTIADKIFQNQYRKNTISDNDVAAMRQYGVKSLGDVGKAANVITGENGIANRIVNDTVAKADPIDNGGVTTGAGGATRLGTPTLLEQLFTKYGTAIPQALRNSITDMTSNELLDKSDANGLISPSDTLQTIRNLEATAKEFQNSAFDKQGNITNLANKQASAVLRSVNEELENRLYRGVYSHNSELGTTGADMFKLNKEVTPADIQALNKIDPSGKLASDFQNVANNGTVADMRSFQAPWVRGSNAVDFASRQGASTGLDLQQAAGGIVAALGHPLIGAAMYGLRTPFGQRLIGNIAEQAGKAPGLSLAGKIPTGSLARLGLASVISGNQNNYDKKEQISQQGISPNDKIISQQVNNEIQDPFASGTAFKTTDAASQYTQLTQLQGTDKYVWSKNFNADGGKYAQQVDSAIANLRNQSNISGKIGNAYSTIRSNDTQINKAIYALQNVPIGIQNRADWIKALQESDSKTYNTLTGYLNGIKGLYGVNPDDIVKKDYSSALKYLESTKAQLIADWKSQLAIYGKNPLIKSPLLTQPAQTQAQPTGLPANIQAPPQGQPLGGSWGALNLNLPTR